MERAAHAAHAWGGDQELTGPYTIAQLTTDDAEHARTSLQPPAKTYSANSREESEVARLSLEGTPARAQPQLSRGTGEARQEHSQTEGSENVQRRQRDPQGKRRAGAGLVSVVIPCYNQARFLGEAIESVLAQSYPHFEIIVVDDGSTDDTAEVAARYPNVRCIWQDNQGRSAARNAGLNYSEGEYVVFLDADDRLLPEALEVGVEQLCAHPECAFVSGNCRLIAADGSPLKNLGVHHWFWPYDEDPHLMLLRGNYIFTPAMVVYRRAEFKCVGGYDYSVEPCEDWDLYLRTVRKFPIHHHGEVVAEYRQHDTNTTSNPAPMLRAAVLVLNSQWKHIKGNKLYREAYRHGIRDYQEHNGIPLAGEIRTDVRKGDWKRAVRGVLVLLRYYPQGVALLDERRMERRKLARRLRVREQELLTHQRQLQFHKQRPQAFDKDSGDDRQQYRELECILAEEYKEVQRLKKRTRQLTRQLRNLNQQAQDGRVRKVWRLLRGGARRAKATLLGR